MMMLPSNYKVRTGWPVKKGEATMVGRSRTRDSMKEGSGKESRESVKKGGRCKIKVKAGVVKENGVERGRDLQVV